MHGPAQERLDQGCVPFESAVGQDHTALRPDVDGVVAGADSHAGDDAVLGDQFDGPGPGERCDPGVEHALEEPRDHRGAGDHDVPGGVVDVGVQPRAGLGVDPDVAEIRWEGRDPVTPGRDAVEVVGDRPQRASAARTAAGQLGLVIRETGGDLEAHVAVRLDEVDHGRAGAHEGLDQFLVHGAEGLRAQVGHRVLDGQFALGRAVMRRDPGDAARDRRGAADGLGLLVDLHPDPHVGAGHHRGQRRRETRPAGAEHDDVGFAVPLGCVQFPHGHTQILSVRRQFNITDSSSAALITASRPRSTTSSRWEIRFRHVAGAGGSRCTGTARP